MSNMEGYPANIGSGLQEDSILRAAQERASTARLRESLTRASRLLSRTGLMTVASTIVAVIATVLSIAVWPWFYHRINLPAVAACVASGLTMFLSVMFDHARRLGDVHFSELSDEYQNLATPRVSRGMKPVADPLEDLPDVEVRVALREFALASELPLFPGKYGPGVFFLLALAIMFVCLTTIGR